MRHEAAELMLRLAERDMTAFQVLSAAEQAHPSVALFHAQQAVEKLLKAVLLLHDIVVPRTHDLFELADLVMQQDVDLPVPIDEIIGLNPYAVLTRYDEAEDMHWLPADEVTALLETVKAWALIQLHGET